VSILLRNATQNESLKANKIVDNNEFYGAIFATRNRFVDSFGWVPEFMAFWKVNGRILLFNGPILIEITKGDVGLLNELL
jgi:hypothetical protein